MMIPIIPVLVIAVFLMVIISGAPPHHYPPDSDEINGPESSEGAENGTGNSEDIIENPFDEPDSEDPHISENPFDPDNIIDPPKPDEPDEQDDSAEPPQLTPPEPTPPPEEEIFSISQLNTGLTRQLDRIAEQYNVVAASLVVYDGNLRDYYTYEYGYRTLSARRPVDVDTKFRVASLSKLVAVMCAMSLVEAGTLDLDADISDYLGYSVRNPGFPDAKITTRMLIQHTSSLYDSNQYVNAGNRNSVSTAKRLLDTGVCYEDWAPGTEFEYSNFGYSILGLVCENISGKRFNTLARDVIFLPLGIDAAFLPSTLIERTNIAAIYGSEHYQRRSIQAQLTSGDSSAGGSDHNQVPGNLMINIIDYTKILTALGNGGILDDVRILSEESVREIHNTNSETEWYIQGLSTRYQNDPEIPLLSSFWHTGSAWGVFAQFNYYIGNGINRGVVIITTGASTDRLENGMVEVCTDMSVLALRLLD